MRRIKQFIGRQFRQVARKADKTVNYEIKEIVNTTLENEKIEEIAIQAVERVLFSLVKRYWLALVVAIIILLGIQSVFLSISLSLLLRR